MLRGESRQRLAGPRTGWRSVASLAGSRQAAVAGVILLAVLVRLPFLPHESWDYTNYVARWYDAIQAHPGFGWLNGTFSNYTPPYLYVLWLATVIPLPAIVAVKLVSIAFDFLLAIAVALVVAEVRPGWKPRFAAFTAVLFAPSVVLNSAAWGQCDAIYAAFAVGAVWLLVRGRPGWAMLVEGVALAIKVQAVFILPLFAVYTLRHPKTLPAWLLVPLPYALAIVPPWLAGRSLSSLLGIYHDQADTYNQLTLNAPSVYAWVDARQAWGPYGVFLALAAVGLLSLVVWRSPLRLTQSGLLLLALAFSLISPFLLPHMHERYFFIADALSVAYAVSRPRRWFVPVLVISASTFSYWPFLYGRDLVPLALLAGLMAAAALVLLYDLATQSIRDRRETQGEAGDPYHSGVVPVTYSAMVSRSSTAEATAATAAGDSFGRTTGTADTR